MECVSIYGRWHTFVWKKKFDHINKLKTVLTKLQESVLTLKKSKCKIGLSQVLYLGFVLNSEGLKPNPLKVKAIFGAPQPKENYPATFFFGHVKFLKQIFA